MINDTLFILYNFVLWATKHKTRYKKTVLLVQPYIHKIEMAIRLYLFLLITFIIGFADFNISATDKFQVRIYTHNIISNLSIVSDSKLGFYVKIYGNLDKTVYSRIVAPVGSLKDRMTRFGAFGVDTYDAMFTPSIGSPNKIGVALKDDRETVAWHIDKIIVIDSESFYYEFVFNKWLNATKTLNNIVGDVYQEAQLTRKYGGPGTIQNSKCMAIGSKIWFKDSDTLYKPGVISQINESSVTISTDSDQELKVSRPTDQDPPMIINDDSFTYSISSIDGGFIAAFNRSDTFYLGTVGWEGSVGFSTSTIGYTYIWRTYRYKFLYKGVSTQQTVHGGIIRKIDQVSTALCKKGVVSPPEKRNPREISALFSCTSSEGLEGHVLAKISAPNAMVCAMTCSRLAQCISFNFCVICNHRETNCELNTALIGPLNRKGFSHCLMIDKQVVS